MRILLAVDASGRLQFVYDDGLAELCDLGVASVFRASHVEPSVVDGVVRWTADMGPVGGPVLGPFECRESALASEVAWLEENYLGGSASALDVA